MELMLGTSYYAKASGDFPEFPVVNMYAEEAPSEEGVSLLSRPGLINTLTDLGAGPIRAIFQQDGVLGSDFFYVSGDEVYRETTFIGRINGSGFVSLAGFENFLFVCAGQSLWGYNGTTFSQIEFPDDADVSKILVTASRLVALRKNSQQFYWTEPLKTTIDGLSFSSAENKTDRLLDAQLLGDTVVLFGTETVEFWPISDDANQPFVPLRGRTFTVGIKNTGASASVNGSFVWVTDKNQVCYQDNNTVLSFPGLEKEIEASENAYLWVFEINGDNCLAVSLETKTWIFHSRSQLWSEFTTVGDRTWGVGCYNGGKFGSSSVGAILSFNNTFTDNGQELERRFRAWLKLTSDSVVVHDITLRTTPGQTLFITGAYTNPSVEMRLSRNGGNTWGAWRTRRLGFIGNFRKWTKWNSNGIFGYPGLLAEFRITDPVPFRVSSVSINEERGGP